MKKLFFSLAFVALLVVVIVAAPIKAEETPVYAYILRSGGVIEVIDTTIDEVVDTITLSETGYANINVVPDGTKAFITKRSSEPSSVIVVDLNTREEVAKSVVDQGGTGGMAVLSPDDSKIYLNTNKFLPDPDYVSIYDTSTYELLNQIPMPTDVNQSAISGIGIMPDGKRLYVTNSGGGGKAYAVDLVSNSVIATIPLDFVSSAFGVVSNLSGTKVYIADGGNTNGRVFVIDPVTNTVIKNIPTVRRSNWLAMSPDGAFLYVSRSGNDGTGSGITIIDTSSDEIVAEIETNLEHGLMRGLSLTPDGKKAYVVMSKSYDTPHQVLVIDTQTRTVIKSILLDQTLGSTVSYGKFIAIPRQQKIGILDLKQGLATVFPNQKNKDLLILHGEFALEEDEDINPVNEEVAVKFSSFARTLPVGSFRSVPNERNFIADFDNGSMIVHKKKTGEVTFIFNERRLNLSGIDFMNPLPISLRIGDKIFATERVAEQRGINFIIK